MITGLTRRLGLFFTLVGAAVLGLFFTSDSISQPQLAYLFWGAAVFALGIALIRRGSAPPTESQRFRTVRRLFSGRTGEGGNGVDAEGESG